MARCNYTCEQLIDGIYDAGAHPDQWPATMSRLASAVGAEGAVMFGFSSRLLPHLRRAVGVSLRLKPASGSAIESVADRLVCPAFTLNREGALIDANLQAQTLAVSCGSFSLSRGGIRFRDPNAHRNMLGEIKRVLDGAPL